jgi:hypothetical protein
MSSGRVEGPAASLMAGQRSFNRRRVRPCFPAASTISPRLSWGPALAGPSAGPASSNNRIASSARGTEVHVPLRRLEGPSAQPVPGSPEPASHASPGADRTCAGGVGARLHVRPCRPAASSPESPSLCERLHELVAQDARAAQMRRLAEWSGLVTRWVAGGSAGMSRAMLLAGRLPRASSERDRRRGA